MNTYSNSKKAWIPTRNPCNQFIVDYLNKIRIEAQKINMDRKYITYSVAINSVKRYPLPIICKTQLNNLNGIGDVLCENVSRLIRNYYRNYLNERGERTVNFNSMQQQKSESEKQSDFSDKVDQLQGLANNPRSNLVDIGDEKSVKSAVLSRAYKPKANSSGAFLLIALAKLSSQNSLLQKKEVKEYIRTHFPDQQFKSWTFLKNLQLHQFVECSNRGSEMRLTEKGRSLAVQLIEKSIQTMSKAKILTTAKQFKSITDKVKDQQTIQKNQLTKIFAEWKQESVLTLVIDCREIKDKSDRDYFQEKLTNRYNITCKPASIAVGDFLWTLDGQVLDYVIQRKKADDLASSINDGRYKEQKYRLKISEVSNVFYLYEGHPSTNSSKSQKQLQSALIKTRVKDRFKVVRTKDVNQSIKFLVFMHNQLERKLRNRQQVFSLGTVQAFNKRNSKSGALTIETVFGLGVKCFPGIGKGTVSQLVKYFKSFQMMHDKLSEFNTTQERVEFLKELLKGCRTPHTFFRPMIDFLFSQAY